MTIKRNTLSDGTVRYIVFQEDTTWYAAALELNIVESGNDPREVLLLLLEAIQGYVSSALKLKNGDTVLNQEPDPEYEKLWARVHGKSTTHLPPIYTFGEQPLGTVIAS